MYILKDLKRSSDVQNQKLLYKFQNKQRRSKARAEKQARGKC
jgi:hypothetical protein